MGGSYPTFDAYAQLAASGELTARVVGAVVGPQGIEQVNDLLEARERGRTGRFAATTVKIMQDGVIENHTAAVLEPYLDADGRPTRNRGTSFVEAEDLKAGVTRLDAEGFQVHIHAIERAVREALDAFETARAANGASDHRHHIAHIQVVHPDDIPRFRELDVVANAQPLWAVNEGQMLHPIPFLGAERSWQYPFASLVRSVRCSRWAATGRSRARIPMGDARRREPHRTERVRVRRRDRGAVPARRTDRPSDGPGRVHDQQRLRDHLDDLTGSIEVGKRADLAVLDRDVFAHPVDEIADASVVLTFVEGACSMPNGRADVGSPLTTVMGLVARRRCRTDDGRGPDQGRTTHPARGGSVMAFDMSQVQRGARNRRTPYHEATQTRPEGLRSTTTCTSRSASTRSRSSRRCSRG